MNLTEGEEWYMNSVGSVAGVVGENVGTVKLSFNKGNIILTRNNTSCNTYEVIGGVVGFLGQPSSSTPGTIEDCYNVGKISGYGTYFGGICGDAYVGSISRTYNVGTVSSTMSNPGVGSVVGAYNNQATIKSSYWLSGTASSGYGILWNSPSTSGIISRTSSQIKNLTSTLGTANWKDDSNNINSGYPILSWQ